MELNELKEYVNQNYSTYKISDLTGKSPTTVKYWLKKFNLKTNHVNFKEQVKVEYGETRFCPRCKKDVETKNFHQRRGRENGSVYCKPCSSDQTLERQRKLKIKSVEYKGGCCVRCGYDKYYGALDFHHLDPSQKDFNLGNCKLTNFEKIKSELDKCILVCSNCHREIHHELKQKERETL